MPCSCSVPGDVPLKQRANTLSQPQVDTTHSWAHVDTQTSPSQEVSLCTANNPASGTQRHHRHCETRDPRSQVPQTINEHCDLEMPPQAALQLSSSPFMQVHCGRHWLQWKVVFVA